MMKQKIKFFIVSYALFLVVSVVSCGCGPHPDKSKVSSFDMNIIETTFESNVLHAANIVDNSVVFNKYSINLEPIISEYYSSNLKIPRFNFLESAYACDYIPASLEDKIRDIEITCTTNYNATYPENTDVKAIFDVIVKGDTKYDLTEYLATYPKVSEQGLILVLKEAPEVTGEYKFTVKINLDGEGIDIYEVTTPTTEIHIN